MPVNNRTFLVFISSTFSDLQQERAISLRDALPRIDKFCAKNEVICQSVGLYWGVNYQSITKNAELKHEDSPCLSLPNDAWEAPGLLSTCPDCGEDLKFNTFFPTYF